VTAPAGTTSDRQSTLLDRRRTQAADAAKAAEQAQARVTELDNRLQTNASMTTQQKQALRNAEADVARLKRLLKAGARERDRLTKARKKAADRTAKAQAKSKAAEAKYDKSLLADLVSREKAKDRAGAAQPPTASTTKDVAPLPERLPATIAPATNARAKTAPAKTAPAKKAAATGGPSGDGRATSARSVAAKATAAKAARTRTPRKATADPTPERPNPAAQSATRTAARKTAAAAGVRSPRTRRTS
jgi:hypothetical protein